MRCSTTHATEAPRTLLVTPNWLGDAIMALPALQLWRKHNPGRLLTVLTKPGLTPIWSAHPAVDDVLELAPGWGGTLKAIRTLRTRSVQQALILPNSFRSALIPAAAGVPERRGFAQQHRGPLLTDRVRERFSGSGRHQSWEVADILLGDSVDDLPSLPAPRIAIGAQEVRDACRMAGVPPDALLIGVIPGAARGESKRWPHFGAAGAQLAREVERARFLVLGTAAEAELCRATAAAIGPHALCRAGRTSLAQFAALLAACRVTLCNDSGGMHLSAAVGTPVVAVFGCTDPLRTGPLGPATVLRREGVRTDRRIAPRSREAAAVLRAIPPAQAVQAVRRALRHPARQASDEADDAEN